MAKSTSTRRRRPSLEIVDAKQAVDLATAQSYSENVFLFVPNLIGKSASSGRFYVVLYSATSFRLYARYHGRPVTILYELSSQILYFIVWNFVSFGCCGWASCPCIGADIKVWRGFRYGHGSVCFVSPIAILYSYNEFKRCTTSCLLCYLSAAYPQYAILFQFLIALDFSSHYMHMYRYDPYALVMLPHLILLVFTARSSLVRQVIN